MLINTGNKYQLWYLIVYNLKIDIYNFYRSKIKFKNKNVLQLPNISNK